MRRAAPRLDLPHLVLFLAAYGFILAVLLAPKGYFLAPGAAAPPSEVRAEVAAVFLAEPASVTPVAFDR